MRWVAPDAGRRRVPPLHRGAVSTAAHAEVDARRPLRCPRAPDLRAGAGLGRRRAPAHRAAALAARGTADRARPPLPPRSARSRPRLPRAPGDGRGAGRAGAAERGPRPDHERPSSTGRARCGSSGSSTGSPTGELAARLEAPPRARRRRRLRRALRRPPSSTMPDAATRRPRASSRPTTRRRAAATSCASAGARSRRGSVASRARLPVAARRPHRGPPAEAGHPRDGPPVRGARDPREPPVHAQPPRACGRRSRSPTSARCARRSTAR